MPTFGKDNLMAVDTDTAECAADIHNEESTGSSTGEVIEQREMPLPWAQLSALLAIRLAEPINFTLVKPFLYQMVEGFDVVKSPNDITFYAGLLLMSYSICQAMTTMYWSPLSDQIGHWPTLLVCLTGDLATFVLFGLSRSYTWALVTRSLNGFFAGNAAVVNSAVVDIADDMNRPRMMALLPLVVNMGIVTGATVGGLLADPVNQYPSIFSHIELFRTFPYLLPCMVGSVTTMLGLVVGLFKLKEMLVAEPTAAEPRASKAGAAAENTPLIFNNAQQPDVPPQKQSIMSLLTPTCRYLMATSLIMCLAASMGDQIYPIFAATPPKDGGLGFSTRGVGISLSISSVAVLYLQLVAYPALVRKYGTLKCCQMGLKIMTPFFFAMPFLSLLSSHIEGMLSGKTFTHLPVPGMWMSFVGFEYCALWVLLIGLLLVRITGTVLSFTSLNLLVSNIAPSKATLGAMNGMQQLGATCVRIIGPLISGTLWSWSIKHCMPFPLNSHLVWIMCSSLMAIALWLTLKLPSSVDIFASGQNQQRR